MSSWTSLVARQRDEFVRHGRLDHLNRLKVFLPGQAEVPHADLANQLDTPEGALNVVIHRLRKQYRDLLRLRSRTRYLAAALTVKRH